MCDLIYGCSICDRIIPLVKTIFTYAERKFPFISLFFRALPSWQEACIPVEKISFLLGINSHQATELSCVVFHQE